MKAYNHAILVFLAAFKFIWGRKHWILGEDYSYGSDSFSEEGAF